ncbi:MAG: phenylalanine--tRNA ligase subunit beta [Bacteroidetes bacterium]|nr:phenylalanine--tRNA ligase subunit beta [Bacteroidota bacterium]
MKICYSWLKDYINLAVDQEKLATLLTGCGLEVENHEKVFGVKGGLEGVVIGEVVSCEKHPNSDHLSITMVDIGKPELLRIVCGAANVRTGLKVPVATVGTILYEGNQTYEIMKSAIRGELSEGMICAEDELGLGTSHEGIMELDPQSVTGTHARQYFNIWNDYVYEIGLTPNRTDAMSHIGVARDIAAVLNNIGGAGIGTAKMNLLLPSIESFKVENHDLDIQVVINDTDACPRYSGVSMTGIRVDDSPPWLKNRLNAIGIRPINNIVDISNYVLFETGQPLHIFDADLIKGNMVIIKKLPHGTKFITLDEIERELTEQDLMICNAHEGMCIAGVFGGLKSGVTESTRRIFIESAHFNPRSVRKTSKHHGLQTDASFRFERSVDPNGTVYALKRAAILIKDLAGGCVSSEIKDIYPKMTLNKEIDVHFQNVNRLIGKKMNHDVIRHILHDLGVEVMNETRRGMHVSVPTFKAEVTREADIIEEILRIYGYNNVEIPDRVHSSLSFSEKPDKNKIQNLISDYLTGNGFYEIMNNSLTTSGYINELNEFLPEHHVEILNPISKDLNVLRQTLLFGGLETIIHNINRKMPDLKLFEFGKIYLSYSESPPSSDVLDRYREYNHMAVFMTGQKHPESWYTDDDLVDFYSVKAIVNNLLLKAGICSARLSCQGISNGVFSNGLVYKYNHRILISFGMIHQRVLKRFDIRQDVFYADFDWELFVDLTKENHISYHELPRFPGVRRDLALLLSENIQYKEIEKIAYQTEKKLLKRISLFDVYEGDQIESGKKSYAISLFIQDEEKTLTDEEVDQVMKKLIIAFQGKLHATVR